MTRRPRNTDVGAVLTAVHSVIDDLAGNLHYPLTTVDLENIEFKPKGLVELAHDATTGEAFVLQAVGRISNDGRFGFDTDFGFGGGFDFKGHKAQATFGRALATDTCAVFEPATTWNSTVIPNLRSILDAVEFKFGAGSRTGFFDEDVNKVALKHKVWQKREPLDTPDESVSAASADWTESMYAPIDFSHYPLLDRSTWPFSNPGKAYDQRDGVPGNLNVTPIPVYKWEDHSLMMPGEYDHLKGALVLAHFVVARTVITRDKKEYFSLEVKRLDFLDSAVQVFPESPRKKRRTGTSSEQSGSNAPSTSRTRA